MESVFEVSKGEKERLKKPFGELLRDDKRIKNYIEKNLEDSGKLIAVGDYSGKFLEGINLLPDLTILDGKIERKKIDPELIKNIGDGVKLKARNPPGKITKKAFREVKKGIINPKRTKLMIEGEEDLLALPSVYFAPEGSIVVYGLRDKGSVVIKTGREEKMKAEEFLKRKQYKNVLVGGTWDRLHLGHKFILLTALSSGEKVVVGVSSEKMSKDKRNSESIESFDKRKDHLEKFLNKYEIMGDYEVERIDSPEGSAIEKGEAIVITDETINNARRINKKRKKDNRKLLELIEVERVKAFDGDPISSSRIRAGKINKEGEKKN